MSERMYVEPLGYENNLNPKDKLSKPVRSAAVICFLCSINFLFDYRERLIVNRKTFTHRKTKRTKAFSVCSNGHYLFSVLILPKAYNFPSLINILKGHLNSISQEDRIWNYRGLFKTCDVRLSSLFSRLHVSRCEFFKFFIPYLGQVNFVYFIDALNFHCL